MPSDNVRSAFRVFHLILGIVVFVQSVQAGVAAAGLLAVPPNRHVAVLAGVEAVAALLFLLRRTTRVGGLLLVGTFALAFVGHALGGEFAGALLVYGAGTAFVIVHGNAWGVSSVRHHAAV
jgi:hypothetical protein